MKMKTRKVLLMLAFLLGMAASVKAQQLTVDYQVKANVNSTSFMAEAGMSDEYRSMMANAMKDFEMKFQLRYNDGESEFAMVPMDTPRSITIMGQTVDGKTLEEQYKGNFSYKNRKKNVGVQRMSLMGKVFLVKDALDADTFDVVSGEKKEILGYECKKAVSKDKKKTVWFTDYIPVADGPMVGQGITGLVLEATDNSNIYMATKISETVSGTFTEPTDGQVMSTKEFENFMKKTTEMLKMGSGL